MGKQAKTHLVAIGLRVFSNHRIYYTIIEDDNCGTLTYRDISFLNVPLALEDPERLNFVRNTILDIICEYGVNRAAIKISEIFGSTLNQLSIERSYLEGVLQESLASSSVEKFRAGRINTMESLAGIPTGDFKKLSGGEMEFGSFPEDEDWGKLTKEARESALTCFAALKL